MVLVFPVRIYTKVYFHTKLMVNLFLFLVSVMYFGCFTRKAYVANFDVFIMYAYLYIVIIFTII